MSSCQNNMYFMSKKHVFMSKKHVYMSSCLNNMCFMSSCLKTCLHVFMSK